MPPSTQTIRTHVATSTLFPCRFPPPGLLTPLLAVATVARDRAALLSASTHGRSIRSPSRAYTAATAWLSHCHWSAREPVEAGANWRGAVQSYGTLGTMPADAASLFHPGIAC